MSIQTKLDHNTDATISSEDDRLTIWQGDGEEGFLMIELSQQAEHRLLSTLLARKAAREAE